MASTSTTGDYRGTKDKAGNAIDALANKATETYHDIADHGREASENVSEVAGNLKGAVDKSVRDQPMATIAMAVVLGFVLGAVWKA